MTRRILRALLSLVLRVFFRRIEVAGAEHVPAEGPVMFVLNHPNSLLDPLFVLCLAPRRVSFLAKAPLFGMPILGALVRALDCLPVYRHQDEGQDPARNRETFEAARALLARGGTIAIFPEGTSHSDPMLRPLKTGAARIALGAATPGGETLRIVPAGLYYTEKTRFRSEALVCFGAPIVVDPVPPGPDGEPPAEAVRALTAHIDHALRSVTMQAAEVEALTLVARAERIFTAEEAATGSASESHPANARLVRAFDRRRRFLAGYQALREQTPDRLDATRARLLRYEAELAQAGLEPERLAPGGFALGPVLRYTVRSLLLFAVLAPAALVGTVVHYPAYRAARFAARRLADDDDVVATVKVLTSMLLFPLTWLALALAVGLGLHAGWLAALITFLGAPLAGFSALAFWERLAGLLAGARALALYLFHRRAFHRLLDERRAIHDEILALAAHLEASSQSPADEVSSPPR